MSFSDRWLSSVYTLQVSLVVHKRKEFPKKNPKIRLVLTNDLHTATIYLWPLGVRWELLENSPSCFLLAFLEPMFKQLFTGNILLDLLVWYNNLNIIIHYTPHHTAIFPRIEYDFRSWLKTCTESICMEKQEAINSIPQPALSLKHVYEWWRFYIIMCMSCGWIRCFIFYLHSFKKM